MPTKLDAATARLSCRLAALLCLASLSAASASAQTPAPSSPTRIVVDEVGRSVPVPARLERVVTLAPNLTELIYALGLEERLVGVSNQCDFPPPAKEKPRVGDALNPSLEAIAALRPDLVLGSTAGNRRQTADALEQLGIPLYGVDAKTVAGILTTIRRLSEFAGIAGRGERLAAALAARLAAVETRVAGRPRPRVLLAIWLEPLITVGSETFLNDVLERAGADSLTAELTESWPRLSVEEAIARRPDVLVLPRSHSLQARFEELAAADPWRAVLDSGRTRVVWLDDAVLRPGPRIVEAIEALAAALHAETPVGAPVQAEARR